MTAERAYVVENVELPEGHAVGIRETHPISELPGFFGSAFGELAQYVLANGASFSGPPFARYFSVEESSVDVEAVFPVTRPLEGSGRIHGVHLAACGAIQVRHTGPYDDLGAAYQAIEAWLVEHGRTRADAPREVYLNGPDEVTGPEQLETLVIQPIR